MLKGIALLRGVNVGGKNKVPMKQLKDILEAHNFLEVRTYIQSGNIIFRLDSDNFTEIAEKIQNLIKIHFQLHVPVMVLSVEALKDALQHAPDWWGQDDESKHNAIFVLPPTSPALVMASVGEIKPAYEDVACYGQVIFWSAPLKTFSKTRWSKVVGTSMYEHITIRNANTTKMLIQLGAAMLNEKE